MESSETFSSISFVFSFSYLNQVKLLFIQLFHYFSLLSYHRESKISCNAILFSPSHLITQNHETKNEMTGRARAAEVEKLLNLIHKKIFPLSYAFMLRKNFSHPHKSVSEWEKKASIHCVHSSDRKIAEEKVVVLFFVYTERKFNFHA